LATAKEIATDLRKMFEKAERGPLRWPDGYVFELPEGLHIAVRATRTGVNFTIENRGWVDRVTGGDRHKLKEHRAEQQAIKDKLDELRSKRFDPPLPGKTEWGMIVISAKATGVTHVSYDGTETRYVYCDRCRAEIPAQGGARHQLLGADGVEELCEDCHEAEMAKELSR
jgi:hypothetical protein